MMTVFCRTVTLLATEPSPVPRPSIFKCSLSTGTRLGTLLRISSRMPFSDLIKRDSIILGVQMKKQEEERLSSYLRSLRPCDVSLKLPALQGLCGLVLVYSKNWMFSSLQLCPQKDVSHRCRLEFYSSSWPWWWMSIIPALEWWRD